MNQPELWLKFARLNPVRWSLYSGYCNCDLCIKYRADAEAWIEQQKHGLAAQPAAEPPISGGSAQ